MLVNIKPEVRVFAESTRRVQYFTRELKRRRRRRQRERQKKAIGLDKQNNNFAHASRFFRMFLSHRYTTTT